MDATTCTDATCVAVCFVLAELHMLVGIGFFVLGLLLAIILILLRRK